jgi:hypothetical protein
LVAVVVAVGSADRTSGALTTNLAGQVASPQMASSASYLRSGRWPTARRNPELCCRFGTKPR